MKKEALVLPLGICSLFLALSNSACNQPDAKAAAATKDSAVVPVTGSAVKPVPATLDTADYDRKMLALSNHDTTGKWPAKAAYPLPGAVLPYNRIVSFYGNLYSKKMGILGQIPHDSMIAQLLHEVARFQAADTTVPVIPALHYITTTAQAAAGKDGMHRYRMPGNQIDTMISWAKPINALVFVDIQVGHSTVKNEVPWLEPYLKLPNVHLGIDPEFSMKHGEVPGRKIGTFTAEDINDAVDFLTDVVRKNHLTPKILIVHRFTQGMVTGYDRIKTTPEVQVVMDMDGFGDKILKRSTYLRYIYREPVQFTGFKLFYKNDTKPNTTGMYTPEELMKFVPKPIYIQFQ